ncbi:MAG: DUF192 domain-containing protein [Phycisphaeraceae bacterium]|nr:MAG: DUF192 domain-containing protein [Phycisphaeraceae bacterium]
MAASALNRIFLALLLTVTLPWIAGCDEKESDELARVRINGVTFMMEIAADDPSRMLGLGGREEIDERGGMIFVFPSAAVIQFVMRDCLVPIDVAFLDASGRVVAMHEMTPEEPRREGESAMAYERRLKNYPSRFPAQFAVETAGGRLREVGLEVGQRVEFDLERLKNMVR